MKAYKIRWSWDEKTDRWLRKNTIGFSLNICCGMSKVGTVRADLDRGVRPDIICDIKNPPFKADSFDTVICDPPFSLYNKFKWVHNLSKIAKKRVILSHPLFDLKLKHSAWKRRFYVTSQYGRFLRLWSFHDKPDMLEFLKVA